MCESYKPNLLQFVPNDCIANNYLKNNFYLKDAIFYRDAEKKAIENSPYNLRFDESEGKTANWSILKHCFFISCFTMLSENDFANKTLNANLANALKKGNVDDNGNEIERPFITISANNLEELSNRLKNQVDMYLKKNNLPSLGLFFKQVYYFDKNEYKKADAITDADIIKVAGTFAKNKVKKINRSNETNTLLDEITFFLYQCKPDFFKDQKEYRVGLTLDDPIDKGEIFIPTSDLSQYIKVHQYQDIDNLTLKDL